MSPLLTLGIALLLGLAFGSFLNVCIVRLPRGESVISPRSHCRECGAAVIAHDNIPVLSFLLLRGRCRHCGGGIPLRYPFVEAATAAWFAVAAWPVAMLLRLDAVSADLLLAAAVHAIAIAIFGFLLLGLAVMDWRTGLLPNEFTLGGLAAGIFFTFAESFFVPPVAVKTLFTPEEVFIAHRLAAALVGWLLLWSISGLYRLLRRQAGMGRGDAKLAAMMGSFLGLAPLGVALFTGILLAAMFGITLMAARRATGATLLPFGSFLAVGGLVATLYGERIATWYRLLFV